MNEPWFAAFEAILSKAEARGYVTHEQFAQVVPHADPAMIEDLLTMMHEKGIVVVESDPTDE